MRLLGNIFWFVFGGLWMGLGWFLVGCIWCLSIIGIPVGRQCFKFARLAFWPFGKSIDYGGGFGSVILNLLWLIFGGLELALVSAASGLVFCLSIIGIPFGLQSFKIAKLALLPFGSRIVVN